MVLEWSSTEANAKLGSPRIQSDASFFVVNAAKRTSFIATFLSPNKELHDNDPELP